MASWLVLSESMDPSSSISAGGVGDGVDVGSMVVETGWTEAVSVSLDSCGRGGGGTDGVKADS